MAYDENKYGIDLISSKFSTWHGFDCIMQFDVLYQFPGQIFTMDRIIAYSLVFKKYSGK
jgi:hypothetical protein